MSLSPCGTSCRDWVKKWLNVVTSRLEPVEPVKHFASSAAFLSCCHVGIATILALPPDR
jgi:hypothetical protein